MKIDDNFAMIRPGVYDPEKKIFTLTFRGLAFEFPAATSFQVNKTGAITFAKYGLTFYLNTKLIFFSPIEFNII